MTPTGYVLLLLTSSAFANQNECGGVALRQDSHGSVAGASAYLTSARAEPMCIRAGLDQFRLAIGVADPAIVSVRLSSPGRLLYQGASVAELVLYDNGTHGDAVPGDKIFTIDQLSLTQTSGVIGNAIVRFVPMTFGYGDNHTEVSSEDLGLTVHYITPSVPLPQPIDLSPDVRATRYVANVVAPLSDAFPGHIMENETVAARYYDLFPDDRDFLVIAKPFNTTGAAASFRHVRNDIAGIGLPMFDDSAEFGSAGVLQGVVSLYFGNVAPGTLNHELLHRWAAFLGESLDLTGSGGHWGAIAAGESGFGGSGPYGGSFDLIEHVSGNTYRALGENSGAFGPLELYAMGLAGINEVASPFNALMNPNFQGYQGLHAIYTADGLRQVTTGDILAAEGPRNPGHLESPKSFRVAMVVAYDRPLSDVELAYYDYAITEYEKASSPQGMTFAAATGGRASISARLPCTTGTGGPECASIPTIGEVGVVALAALILAAGAAIARRGPTLESQSMA